MHGARRALPQARSHPGAKMKKYDLINKIKINLIIFIDLIINLLQRVIG